MADVTERNGDLYGSLKDIQDKTVEHGRELAARYGWKPAVVPAQQEAVGQLVASSGNPVEDSYRYNTAIAFSQYYGIPLPDAMRNLDSLYEAQTGKKYKPNATAWQSILNSFTVGTRTVDLQAHKDKWRSLVLDGRQAEADTLEKEIEDEEAYLASLSDYAPRSWVTKALQWTAGTIPYTAGTALASGAAGLAAGAVVASGGLALPAILAAGAVAGATKLTTFAVTRPLFQGDAFWDLMHQQSIGADGQVYRTGIDKDVAASLSMWNGIFNGAIEAEFGLGSRFASSITKGVLAGAVKETLGTLMARGVTSRALLSIGKAVMDGAGEAAQEGMEELVDTGTRVLGYQMSGYAPRDTVEDTAKRALTAAGQAWVSSMLMGLPVSGIQVAASIADARALVKDAKGDSRATFVSKHLLGKPTDKISYAQWFNALNATYDRYHKGEAGETTKESFHRMGDGKLYATEEIVSPKDDAGVERRRYLIGDPEVEDGRRGARYGAIDFELSDNGNKLTITDVSMGNGHEDLVAEAVTDLINEYSKSDVAWETGGDKALDAVKSRLIERTGSLQPNSADQVKGHQKVVDAISRAFGKTLNNKQLYTAADVLEIMAGTKGMTGEQYLAKYFARGGFDTLSSAEGKAVLKSYGMSEEQVNGLTEFVAGGKAIVYAAEHGNFSTFVHETFHVLERVTDQRDNLVSAIREADRSGELARYVQSHGRLFGDGLFTTDEAGNQVEASRRISEVVASWGDGKELTKAQQDMRSEIMARLFEGYLYDGKTFSPQLKTIFAKLAQWMRRVYRGMETNGVTLTDDIVRAYDQILADRSSGLAEAERAGVLAQTRLENTPTPAQREQLSKIADSLAGYESLFTPEEKAEKAYALRHSVVASVSGHDITDYEGTNPIEKGKNWTKDNISEPAITAIGKVYVTPTTIKTSLNHLFGAEKLNAIPAIFDVLENGEYLGGMYDLFGKGKRITNYYFAGRVLINEQEKILFCRVRRAIGDELGQRFYVHEVFSEDEIKEIPITGTADESQKKLGGRSLYLNILRTFLNDKTESSRQSDVLAQGYDEKWNMSNNAVTAYSDGKRPLKEWRKADIVEAVNTLAGRDVASGMKIDELRGNFLVHTEWHHVGSAYRRQDFYALDLDGIRNAISRLPEADWNKYFYDGRSDDLERLTDIMYRQKTDKAGAVAYLKRCLDEHEQWNEVPAIPVFGGPHGSLTLDENGNKVPAPDPIPMKRHRFARLGDGWISDQSIADMQEISDSMLSWYNFGQGEDVSWRDRLPEGAVEGFDHSILLQASGRGTLGDEVSDEQLRRQDSVQQEDYLVERMREILWGSSGVHERSSEISRLEGIVRERRDTLVGLRRVPRLRELQRIALYPETQVTFLQSDSQNRAVTPERFHDAITQAVKNLGDDGLSVDVQSVDVLKDKHLYLSEDGKTGFAITDDGDLEAVFSDPSVHGRMTDILTTAIANGAVKLDCYDKRDLVYNYMRIGFEPIATNPYEKGWNTALDDVKDDYKITQVVAMAYNGKSLWASLDNFRKIRSNNREDTIEGFYKQIASVEVAPDYNSMISRRDQALADQMKDTRLYQDRRNGGEDILLQRATARRLQKERTEDVERVEREAREALIRMTSREERLMDIARDSRDYKEFHDRVVDEFVHGRERIPRMGLDDFARTTWDYARVLDGGDLYGDHELSEAARDAESVEAFKEWLTQNRPGLGESLKAGNDMTLETWLRALYQEANGATGEEGQEATNATAIVNEERRKRRETSLDNRFKELVGTDEGLDQVVSAFSSDESKLPPEARIVVEAAGQEEIDAARKALSRDPRLYRTLYAQKTGNKAWSSTDLQGEMPMIGDPVGRMRYVMGESERKRRSEARRVSDKALAEALRTGDLKYLGGLTDEIIQQAGKEIERLEREVAEARKQGRKDSDQAVRDLKERIAEKEARRREARRQREYMQGLADFITRPVPQNVDIDTALEIRMLVEKSGIDPHFRNGRAKFQGKLQSVEEIKAWLEEHGGMDAHGAEVSASLYDRLTRKPLNEWTVGDLEDMASYIWALEEHGRQVLLGKKVALQLERRGIQAGLVQTLKESGRTPDTGLAITDEAKAEGRKKRDRQGMMLETLNPEHVARLLDNMQEHGAFFEEFVQKKREAQDKESANKAVRIAGVLDKLQAAGYKLDDLNRTVSYGDKHVSVAELAFAELSRRNPETREAYAYGVLVGKVEKDTIRDRHAGLYETEGEMMQAVNDEIRELGDRRYQDILELAGRELTAKDRQAMETISEDLGGQIGRINEVAHAVYNMHVDGVQAYLPHYRMDVGGVEANVHQQMADMMNAEASIEADTGVFKGFTKKRIEISPFNQTPIQSNLVDVWRKSLDATEHFIAFSALNQEWNAVARGFSGRSLVGALQGYRGKAYADYLSDYMNEVVTPKRLMQGDSRLVKALRGNLPAAYLAFKPSGVILQMITSPAAFLKELNPVEYLAAVGQWMADMKGMDEFIMERSPFMRQRQGVIEQAVSDAIANDPSMPKWQRRMSRFTSIGMAGMEFADHSAVHPGWIALYRKKLRELGGIETQETMAEAARYADNVVHTTQPVSDRTEMAPLFKKGGAMGVLTQFTASMNVIWNNITVDAIGLAMQAGNKALPAEVRMQAFRRLAGQTMGYALAGLVLGAVQQGFKGKKGDDDDLAKKVRKGLYYATTQFTGATPLVSDFVDWTVEKVLTGEGGYVGGDSFYPALTAMQRAMSAKTPAKQAENALRALGLATGMPVSGIRQAVRAVEERSLLPFVGR